jgi:cellulose synthase/poly-beta-1,6-N-acetylglucosamine synthase-like glycosyltransferase
LKKSSIFKIYFFKFNDSFLKIFLSYFFNYKFNIKNIERYLRLCNSEKLINRKKFKRNKFPKVSIISPIYNREKYILRFLRSVQNQKFNDIEIIFIDDSSKDNSVKLIEKYQERDGRIILIKNKKNKGTLICRNIGALNSRGEYLIFSDPDDIISKNILNNYISLKCFYRKLFNEFLL